MLYIYGDIFESPAQVLVNPVNTVGVMAKGLPNDFKRFFPEMFTQYQAQCQADQFHVGQLMLVRTPHKWILNLPTKQHFQADARLEFIEAGLKRFIEVFADAGITSVSFPMLGVGDDNLDWDEVRPVIEFYLRSLPIPTYVHIMDSQDPFFPERRNLRRLRTRLNHYLTHVSFEQFWDDLLGVLQTHRTFRTLDSGASFRVKNPPNKIALQIRAKGVDGYISERLLQDWWRFMQRVGYALPIHFPSGLDTLAPYLISLTQHLPYVYPRTIQRIGGDKEIGLLYQAEVERQKEFFALESIN